MDFVSILSMTFTNRIAIPIRNLNNKIAGSIRNALAAQTATGGESGRERQFFILGITHFGYALKSLPDDTVAGRAGTYSAARMIDLNPMS